MGRQVPFGCIEPQKKNISREGNLTKKQEKFRCGMALFGCARGKRAIEHASTKIVRIFLAQLEYLQLFRKR